MHYRIQQIIFFIEKYKKNILIFITFIFIFIFIFILMEAQKIAIITKNPDNLPVIKAKTKEIKIKHKLENVKINKNDFYNKINDNFNDKKEIKIIEENQKKYEEITLNTKIEDLLKDDFIEDVTKDKQMKIDNMNVKEIKINKKIEENQKFNNQNNYKSNLFKVQLAALKNKSLAENFIIKTKKNFNHLLKNLDIFITEINLEDKGFFYRIQIGFFTTKDEAKIFCNNYLKNSNKNLLNCIVVK